MSANARSFIGCLALLAACRPVSSTSLPPGSTGTPTLARVYYWRAKPGRFDEYSRYISEYAEPIDHEAQRRGAFVSISTTVARDTSVAWTHARVFRLRDSAQLAGLSAALDAAGVAIVPDSATRRARSTYSASLRDRVGDATVDLVNGQLLYLPLPGYGGAPVREGWATGADGVRLFYRLVGSGRDTIVFVHGGPGTGMREGYDLERLATLGHVVLMYDQRGSGYSELVSDTSRLGLKHDADDLAAVLRGFHIGRAKLLGLSWGAAVVARVAADHPDLVDRIVFLSPISPTQALLTARAARLDSVNGRPDAGGLAAVLAEAARPIPDSLLEKNCHADRARNYAYRFKGPHMVAPRGDPCDYPPAVLRNRRLLRIAGLQSLGGQYDLRPTLARITAPSLVVEGERTNVPLEATREFARALPKASLVLIPNAGHQSWLDEPDAVRDVLDAFFRGR